MVKRLILFRHGKSDWQAVHAHDRDRTLAKRGIKAAKAMGQFLSNAAPDLVITSSAVRAKMTVDLAMQAGQWDCPVQVSDRLYAASPEQVLIEIQQVQPEINTLLLAGHEPTWSELTSQLIGGGQIRFPTAALSCISFEVSTWAQVNSGQGTLRWFLVPKLLMTAPSELS